MTLHPAFTDKAQVNHGLQFRLVGDFDSTSIALEREPQ